MDNIKGFEDRAYMLRMKGEHACNFIEDKSLDFVYIDANHTYQAVKEDIRLWYPKVKSGGLIMGHDYLPDYFYEGKTEKDQALYTFPDGQPEKSTYTGMFGVNPAVDEFCLNNGYKVNKTDEFLATWWFIKK
jgi:predicted O-methyltransferase YrrM